MKRCKVPQISALIAVVTIGLSVALHAQVTGNPRFELEKFHINQPKSPEYEGDKSFPYTRNSEQWLQVVCEYTVGHPDGWLDNVTFNWHVLLLGAQTKNLVFLKSITYDKVEADGDAKELSVVYLSPRDIRRYYSKRNASISSRNVVCYVEVLVDGIKVSDFTYPRRPVSGIPENWWQNRAANRVDNVLLSRIESPWAVMDYDTWVPERPSDKPAPR